jgi:hypothetical protein
MAEFYRFWSGLGFVPVEWLRLLIYFQWLRMTIGQARAEILLIARVEDDFRPEVIF